MKISGANVIDHPVDKVWEALLDPRVLVATIPGCERLEATDEHQYAMTVTAGVAAIKGTYDGSCALSDLRERESLVMRLTGAGAPGTIDATVSVSFSETAPGRTQVAYDADAIVGGMVGGVGQRMLTSVSKRMAGEFFANVGESISRPAVVEAVGTTEAGAAPVFTAPPKERAAGVSQDFLTGIALGAGLVALGVVLGGVFGRRRR